MRRRALLVTLGGLATGCLGAPLGSPSTTESPSNVEYQLTDLSATTSTERPTVKYVLKPMAFYSADAVERERDDSAKEVVVVDVADIEDPAVRDMIETAIREDAWRSNELPDGLAALVERVDFFTGVSTGATYTHVGLELYRLHPDRPPAIQFDASVTDEWVSSASPGALEFFLTNTGEETQEIFSGTVPPFGMVSAEGAGDEFLLWRDYTDEGCVSFTDSGLAVCSIGVLTTIEPGEEISREYEVLPSTTDRQPDYTVPPGTGQYRITGTVGYSARHGAPGSTLQFDVGFTLE
jgi:hypothetical protein